MKLRTSCSKIKAPPPLHLQPPWAPPAGIFSLNYTIIKYIFKSESVTNQLTNLGVGVRDAYASKDILPFLSMSKLFDCQDVSIE